MATACNAARLARITGGSTTGGSHALRVTSWPPLPASAAPIATRRAIPGTRRASLLLCLKVTRAYLRFPHCHPDSAHTAAAGDTAAAAARFPSRVLAAPPPAVVLDLGRYSMCSPAALQSRRTQTSGHAVGHVQTISGRRPSSLGGSLASIPVAAVPAPGVSADCVDAFAPPLCRHRRPTVQLSQYYAWKRLALSDYGRGVSFRIDLAYIPFLRGAN